VGAAPGRTTAAEPPDRFRIDELARLAGTTVRNARAYQDRGLLPPPARVGRVGWYSEAHLARLRLIGRMLGRGYSLANIAELIDSGVRGRDLADLFGSEAVTSAPWGGDRFSTILAESGVPAGEAVELAADIAQATDHIADRWVGLITTHLAGDGDDGHRTEVLRGLRPLATQVVGAGLAAALDRHIGAAGGEQLGVAAGPGEPAAP
jgi:DNA-binding transcriptional MerR regulator